jgi:multimeric flavodoxin WrbA
MPAKVQVIFYSMYGHVYQMAEAVAAGAREGGAEVSLWQVLELVPDEILEKSGAAVARAAVAHVPIAKPAQLAEADAIIFGTLTGFSQHGRPDAKFPRSNRRIVGERCAGRQSGQRIHEHRIAARRSRDHARQFSHDSLHHGMIVVGTPYTAPLPAVTRSADALAPGAPLVWEGARREFVRRYPDGRPAGDGRRLRAGGACRVRLETAINRVTGVPMELRAAVAVYDPRAPRYTVHTSAGGGVVRQRDDIAAVLGVSPVAIRVVSGDVGGNFGIRNSTCPEFALVAWSARRVGRPVKWTCDRRDAFATDFHGRDLTSEAELALDEDGRFLALRATNTSNLGASAISFVPLAKGIAISSSVYDIPCSYMRGRAVVTNTAPTLAYRSAGRVRSRADDRHCLPPPRLRPPGDPAAQPRPAESDAVPQSARPRL